MKSFILFFVLATSFVAILTIEQEWRIELLDPKGFRLFIQHYNGISAAKIVGQIFRAPNPDNVSAEYAGQMILRSDGWWTYENRTTTLNTGDRVVFVILNTIPENSTDFDPLDDVVLDQYEVLANATRVPA